MSKTEGITLFQLQLGEEGQLNTIRHSSEKKGKQNTRHKRQLTTKAKQVMKETNMRT